MGISTEHLQEIKPFKHVHFIGIGGYGMSAVARVLLEMGYKVTGSDVARKELVQKLEASGAQVFIGHKPENIHGADVVVYSTDIPRENIELTTAKQLGIPLWHRSQMLAWILNRKKGIAVAGAHGKTTTSSMISLVMVRCGLDPTYIIGGEIMGIDSNASAGKGEYVVAEADESDGSFLEYQPDTAVILNIEPDHLENYGGDFANLKNAYQKFLGLVKPEGKSVLCVDDPYIRELIEQKIQGRVITYGIDHPANFMAKNIVPGDRRISFEVYQDGERLGSMTLNVPGIHNVYNALATTAVCMNAGLTFNEIKDAIVYFSGAKRRFQVIGEVDNILVVDDYAHHPTEIDATLKACQETKRRTIGIFQPQRYTRTYFLLNEFSKAFKHADQVIITDIYSPANDQQIEGVSARKLVELIKENSNPNTIYLSSKEEIIAYLLKNGQPNDLIITMGAGDIWQVAYKLVDQLKSLH